MDNLISVILPVYNGEKYLDESIQSILSQTHKNFELIIINDGSTDKSDHEIRKFLNDKRVKYFSRANKGLVHTLNEAINYSSGDYIARMDQDDICSPERLKKQLNFMKTQNIDICGSSYEIINEFGTKIKTIKSLNENFEIFLSAMMVPFIHPSVMFRNFFKEQDIFYGNNSKLEAEDYDLWIKLYGKNLVFGNINDVLIKYRILNSSMSRTNKIKIFNEVYLSCKNFNRTYREKILSKYSFINGNKINNQIKPILFKSILNFINVNGIKKEPFRLIFKLNFYHLIIGFLLFLKQELTFFTYTYIKKY
jgi:glycosyltransferase involved in cell wall biosynthesis